MDLWLIVWIGLSVGGTVIGIAGVVLFGLGIFGAMGAPHVRRHVELCEARDKFMAQASADQLAHWAKRPLDPGTPVT